MNGADWYALTTAPRHELALVSLLREDEALRRELSVADAYCPVERYHVWLKMKRHPIERLRTLTPRYVFVRCRDPLRVVAGLAEHGAQDVLMRCGTFEDEPAPISNAAIEQVKVREAEIAMKRARRTDRSKRQIRQGSTIKVGDRIEIPHLGINVANTPVEQIVGGRAEASFGGMRLTMALEDLSAA